MRGQEQLPPVLGWPGLHHVTTPDCTGCQHEMQPPWVQGKAIVRALGFRSLSRCLMSTATCRTLGLRRDKASPGAHKRLTSQWTQLAGSRYCYICQVCYVRLRTSPCRERTKQS